jgi:hypothetical protein
MTTTVKVHVNGRYKATVKQDDKEPVEVHGNYDGSPNPSGEHSFSLPHPASSAFVIGEEQVPEATAPAGADQSQAQQDPKTS